MYNNFELHFGPLDVRIQKNEPNVFEGPFQALSNDFSTKQIGPMVLNLYDIEDYKTVIEMYFPKTKLVVI